MKDDFFTIDKLKAALTPEEIMSGSFGVEREGLRAYANGQLSLTPHPAAFGNKLTNPYITTDFSESQVEIVTPPCASTRACYIDRYGQHGPPLRRIPLAQFGTLCPAG